MTFKNLGRLLLIVCICIPAGYLASMCADGFNKPIVPLEATLCFVGMFGFPIVAIILLIKLARKWRKHDEVRA